MGRAIEALALQQGHTIALRVDNKAELDAAAAELAAADVAVEFTMPAAAVGNLMACFEAGVPVVCGTTGWYDRYEAVADACRKANGALLAATNFSIGMNIMFALNRRLADLMRGRGYEPSVAEVHHVHKLDAPSGTAITLRSQMAQGLQLDDEQAIPIASSRIGEVPGTHTVTYTSAIDTITLTHEAHSRQGLAQGALAAACFLAGRHGIFTMDDLLGLDPSGNRNL